MGKYEEQTRRDLADLLMTSWKSGGTNFEYIVGLQYNKEDKIVTLNCIDGEDYEVILRNTKISQKEEKQELRPLGVMPRAIWDKHRMRDLKNTIQHYISAEQEAPVELVSEYNELCEKRNR
jgi:thermostable 8-oxoguanine DNA glycosylase